MGTRTGAPFGALLFAASLTVSSWALADTDIDVQEVEVAASSGGNPAVLKSSSRPAKTSMIVSIEGDLKLISHDPSSASDVVLQWGLMDKTFHFLASPKSELISHPFTASDPQSTYRITGSIGVVPIPDEAEVLHSVVVGFQFTQCHYSQGYRGHAQQPDCTFKGKLTFKTIR
jgi:hypothetical protein